MSHYKSSKPKEMASFIDMLQLDLHERTKQDKREIDMLRKERDFYFEKLLQIEQVLFF